MMSLLQPTHPVFTIQSEYRNTVLGFISMVIGYHVSHVFRQVPAGMDRVTHRQRRLDLSFFREWLDRDDFL